MILTFHCSGCQQTLIDLGLTEWESSPQTGTFELNITTEPILLFSCPNGHETEVTIDEPPYAMLYERALERVASGSTRDAVIDAYTAFEMYLAQVPARFRYDRERGASPKTLRKELERSVKTAERAMGAALAAVSMATSEPPPRVDEERTTRLRNRAVHAGYYPTPEEAERMCVEVEATVLQFESALARQTSVNEHPYWRASLFEHSRDFRSQRGLSPKSATSISVYALLGSAMTDTPRETAAERIRDMRSGRYHRVR